MSILLFLILASLTLALTALVGFVWAVKSGQFEDTCTPSMRVLMEEDERRIRRTETAEAVKKDLSMSDTQLKSGVNGKAGITTQFPALSRDAVTKTN